MRICFNVFKLKLTHGLISTVLKSVYIPILYTPDLKTIGDNGFNRMFELTYGLFVVGLQIKPLFLISMNHIRCELSLRLRF